MHVMSALFGALALKIVPKVYTFYISSFLFAVFGIKMLKEGWNMSAADTQEEMEEVQEELRKKESENIPNGSSGNLELGRANAAGSSASTKSQLMSLVALLFSPIFIQ